jgi:signal transduction histidine kinase/ActR/RegA family two-component response regulator
LLVVAPIGRDAELMCEQLGAAGLTCEARAGILDVCEAIGDGVGAVIVTEEALDPKGSHELARILGSQPPWSEIPLVILTGAPSLDMKPRSFESLRRLTNVTLVDRPVRVTSLISAAQSAVRARERQYEVRDLMAQLEERIHERDRFLAVLGHELRNPLGAILLASQMTDGDGKLAGEHAQLIERQSRHLTRLVNDLLDLSRVAAGKIVLKKETIDLREVAAQSLRVAEPIARHHGVELQLDAPGHPVPIEADGVRVDQIIANMVTNAVKYTPDGGHVLVKLGTDGTNAFIQVTDDGVGIAPERIGGIFELFAQAENTIGRAQGGMGIGLALVRNLVELHGGTVSAKSDGLDKGSEFVVRLPLASGMPARDDIARRTEQTASQPRRIVIVEDNPDVRHLLQLKLRRLGHTVSDAADGVKGLQVLLSEQPDLALIDLGLPGIDGFEVAREARQQLGSEVVLIAVSGFGRPDDKRRALDAGFDEHITKPADVKDIETLLQRFPPRNSSTRPRV